MFKSKRQSLFSVDTELSGFEIIADKSASHLLGGERTDREEYEPPYDRPDTKPGQYGARDQEK